MPISLRHALRSLGRTPVFAVAAILTLTLGVGSIAATFAIVHGVLLAPLPYGHPDRLVSVDLTARREGRHLEQPLAAYFTYQRLAKRLSEIGYYRTGNANIWTGLGGDTPERVTATWVTPSTIPLFQIPPIAGRAFTEDEARIPDPNVVILSEAVWRTRFNGDRNAIGKKLVVNAVPRTIVGVMPDRFAFPSPDTKLWLPARVTPTVANTGDFTYSGVARLAPGATADEAQRELAVVLPRMTEWFPQLESGTSITAWLEDVHPTPEVVPLRDEVTSGIARTLWMVALAAALVLLVAWANVANLMLIRADGRQLELAVREALGASRWRIITYFFGESFTLAMAAGLLALVAADGAVRALVAFGPTAVPRLAELHIDAATVAFIAIVSTVGGIVCGALPAFRIRRSAMSINLRDGARGDTASKARHRVRTVIAALQIAVAFVVTAGSVLLLHTFYNLYQEQPGFSATNVMTVWTQLPFARYGDSASVAFYARLTDAVGKLPNVSAVGLTTQLPLGFGETPSQSFVVAGDRELSLPTNAVDGGYFAAMRIPLLAGRVFDRTGVQRAGDVVISERMAASIWHDATGRGALGQRIALAPSGLAYRIVGVVGDVRSRDLAVAPAATVYLPQAVPMNRGIEPGAQRTMALVVKTRGAPEAVVSDIRRIARDLDPAVPIFNIESMTDVMRASTSRLSLTLVLMSAAAAITLVLGTIGLYGVMAYMVALRRRELGVRIALGADPSRLARTVALRGLSLAAYGVVAGWLLYIAAAPFLRAFLYGVTPSDPMTLGGATLALIATASLASWIPARRAAAVDPADALRAE